MYYSDDPAADFDRYDRDLEKLRMRRPVCRQCQEPIQDEHYYHIEFRDWCEKCMMEEFRRCVETDFYFDQE